MKMKKNPISYLMGLLVLILIVFAIALTVTELTGRGASQAPPLKPGEAYAMIQKNQGNPEFAILDVRTPEEFQAGHIEGAININLYSDAFRGQIDKLDRQKTYLVYCRTGRRSQEAVQIMQGLGFTNLRRFKGDMVAWRAENLPLVR